ncbi:MAG: hypothetical protein ACEPO2_18515 [Pelagibaca sp.]
MANDQDKEGLLRATILLTPIDYQAIGVAVTTISRLESLLVHVNTIFEFGVGAPPNEAKHRPRMQAMMKKSFRKRVDVLVENVRKKTGSEESTKKVRDFFDNILKWRDFLCHGTIEKLPDGRLKGQFWDRLSFDEDHGHIEHTFTAHDLYELSQGVLEMSAWLYETFGIEQHITAHKNRK